MQIGNATVRTLVGATARFLLDAGVGAGSALNCTVVEGYPTEKVDRLPLVALVKADDHNFPVSLGRIGGGKDYLIAVNIWGNTLAEAREIGDLIQTGMEFQSTGGTFRIYDFGADKPEEHILGTGQTEVESIVAAEQVDPADIDAPTVVILIPILVYVVPK